MKKKNYKIIIIVSVLILAIFISIYLIIKKENKTNDKPNEEVLSSPKPDVVYRTKEYISSTEHIIIEDSNISVEEDIRTRMLIKVKNVDEKSHAVEFLDVLVKNNDGEVLSTISTKLDKLFNPGDTFDLEIAENKVYEEDINLEVVIYE